jgi:hypothetical protein
MPQSPNLLRYLRFSPLKTNRHELPIYKNAPIRIEIELHDVAVQSDYWCWITHDPVFLDTIFLQTSYSTGTYTVVCFAYLDFHHQFIPGISQNPIHANVPLDPDR